jgi:hypothetical protein
MAELFGVDIAAVIFQATNGQLLSGVLTRTTHGTRTEGQLSAGRTPTTVVHQFQGFVERRSEVRRAGTLVREAGEFVAIIGNSVVPLTAPQVGDRVQIEGRDFEVTEITNRDPASAMYLCRVK